VNTAYGQGNNVSSLKQYHILLGYKGYGLEVASHRVAALASLIDVAPTVLDYLHLGSMKKVDGVSMRQALLGAAPHAYPARPLFIETGDRVDGMETDNIQIYRVVKNAIGAYRVDSKTGALILTDAAFAAVNKNKQRAVIWGDWLLAYYPSEQMNKLVSDKATGSNQIASVAIPPYYILANIKTGKWTVELASPFARTAPVDLMLSKLRSFYGNEMPVVRPSNFG
jgi:hypothetical protein